ncbi:MAG: hypothetical protein R3C19_20945 [Planctomycetaceae bacterium]
MPRGSESDLDTCCFLKQHLEPRFRVVAEPSAQYYSEWQYRYRILDGDRLLHELHGDFRDTEPGSLITAAKTIVANLANGTAQSDGCDSQWQARPTSLPIASRLPPERTETTYFSSGRAAFAWLIGQVVRPRCVYLPSFVCWSLISAMQRRFPDSTLKFYPVDRDLSCRFPAAVDEASALVFVHYFGHRCAAPNPVEGLTLLEDASHLPLEHGISTADYVFGSLRKAYRTADGGFLRGRFNPVYEPDRRTDAWLRLQARDWRDMREAENMTDRDWSIADISSQSLAVVLQTDTDRVRQQRHANDTFLSQHVNVGRPLIQFRSDDCPLLHNRLLDSRRDRDDLRSYLASRGVFCSIHWPTHPYLLQRQDDFDVTDAVWLESHVLSIPLSEHLDARQLETICNACDDWQRSGS